MSPQTNHSLSVDCVIFGFDGQSLKVLLVRRNFINGEGVPVTDYKLPGDLIYENEDLRSSAYRTLGKYASTRDIYLRQMHVFSHPDRVSGDELKWLNDYYHVNTTRVVKGRGGSTWSRSVGWQWTTNRSWLGRWRCSENSFCPNRSLSSFCPGSLRCDSCSRFTKPFSALRSITGISEKRCSLRITSGQPEKRRRTWRINRPCITLSTRTNS